MRFRLLFLLAAVSSFTLHAEEIPLTDSTVIPGERVGPIEKGMTLMGLKALLLGTKEKMQAQDLPGPEGETTPAATLFKGTGREALVIFDQQGDEKVIVEVRIIGKDWKLPGGLKRGMSVEEVEKVNGKPYKVAGFGWDYGGYADFSGGSLEGKISVRFEEHEKDLDKSLTGEKEIPSDDEKLRKAKVSVGEIGVMLPVKDEAPEGTAPAEEDDDKKPDAGKDAPEKKTPAPPEKEKAATK